MDGRVDLLCGSGIREFTRRSDGVDLISELEKQYDFVRSVDEITARKGKVICIDETMDDAAEQANLTLLADATRASIAKLQERGGKGFFLMVEGAKIDYAGHSRCLPGSIIEMLSFDLAVAEALKFADRNGETLVVVTADGPRDGRLCLRRPYPRDASRIRIRSRSRQVLRYVYEYGDRPQDQIADKINRIL